MQLTVLALRKWNLFLYQLTVQFQHSSSCLVPADYSASTDSIFPIHVYQWCDYRTEAHLGLSWIRRGKFSRAYNLWLQTTPLPQVQSASNNTWKWKLSKKHGTSEPNGGDFFARIRKTVRSSMWKEADFIRLGVNRWLYRIKKNKMFPCKNPRRNSSERITSKLLEFIFLWLSSTCGRGTR